ncbi:MAG: hypothetical protein WC699_15420 [Bacteroidales bacterium]|jgi:hypothetical protein
MKKRFHTGFRERLFLVLMVLLTLPLIQTATHLVKETKLKGAIVVPENPKLSTGGWFSGSWQPKKEKWLNDTFGFRGLFVRINNQITLSLFREVHAFGVVFGQRNYLYAEKYIKASYGADFIGVDSIAHRINRLKFIRDELLNRYNKNLMIVITAGKGSFYPEYFPVSNPYTKGPTNYENHVRLARETGLQIIDFDRWFVENKTRSPYPLYPKYGMHWSVYGATLVADSLISYIERIRGIDIPSISWDRIRIKRAYQDDYDLGAGLNLLFKLRREKMAYPVLKFEPESGKTKPSVLVIADSFYWNLFKLGFTKGFSTSDFWYYNKDIYHTVMGPPVSTAQVDLWDQIMKHDVIILMATESNLPEFGWGFIEDTYHLLKRRK